MQPSLPNVGIWGTHRASCRHRRSSSQSNSRTIIIDLPHNWVKSQTTCARIQLVPSCQLRRHLNRLEKSWWASRLWWRWEVPTSTQSVWPIRTSHRRVGTRHSKQGSPWSRIWWSCRSISDWKKRLTRRIWWLRAIMGAFRATKRIRKTRSGFTCRSLHRSRKRKLSTWRRHFRSARRIKQAYQWRRSIMRTT